MVCHPYDYLYNSGIGLLARAGINDTALAEVAAVAGEEAGAMTSELYFDGIGYTMANLLFDLGIETVLQHEGLISDLGECSWSCRMG